MIGQTQLLADINTLIGNNKFPKFAIIWGIKGSGKKCLCKEIAKALNCNTVICPDIKVDTIRDIIQEAYKTKVKTLYIIPDSDTMSLAAKNALLKVTEEPPNNAYFIMTLEDLDNTLRTIKSRGVAFQMNNYTVNDILDYYKTIDPNMADKNIIQEVCEVPGEVNYLNSVGISAFYEFVQKVFGNIAVVNGANAFKIGSNLLLTEKSTGYDLKLFLRAFKQVCWDTYRQHMDIKYIIAMNTTTDAIQKCQYKSVNKQMIFDTWLLEIREEWM